MQSNQSKSSTVPGESNLYNVGNTAVCSEPWWSSTGHNSFNPTMMRGNASDSSSLEQSVDGQSQSEGGVNNEDDDSTKQSPSTGYLQPDINNGREHSNLQHVPSTLHPRNDGSLMQPPHLELVGHSIACTSNPYDPYYGGMMAAYGQPLVQSHMYDMHHPRMPLPLEMAQEPVYVNAKQYHGILRRRQSRAKAELEKKLIKTRKPYLHESRHQHALRRARSTGGRFAKKTGADTSDGLNSGSPGNATQSGSEMAQPNGAKMHEAHNLYGTDIGNFRSQNESTQLQSLSVKTGEGPTPGQQWGSIPTSRALTMQ